MAWLNLPNENSLYLGRFAMKEKGLSANGNPLSRRADLASFRDMEVSL